MKNPRTICLSSITPRSIQTIGAYVKIEKMTVQEFQAVVLAAGRGSRMTELTGDRPKCLLPVGNQPILCHSIGTLEKAGFHDILILVLESEATQIQHALQQHDVKINYKLVSIPSEQSNDWGTADSLRYLIKQEKIEKDVLLMSCDLYTNTNIKQLLYSYRKHKASFAALFFVPSFAAPVVVPGSKSKCKPERDVVGIDTETSRLVFIASASDFEDNIHLNHNILRRHSKVSLRCDLTDGHLYILSYGVVQYLSSEKSMSTLKGEFFPYIVGKQNHKASAGNEDSSVVNDNLKNSIFEFVKKTKLEENIIDISTYNDHEGDLKKAYFGDILRCYALVADSKDFGIRINSLQYLCQANEMYMKGSSSEVDRGISSSRIDVSAVVETNQIDSWSFVGAGSLVRDKTSIKCSTIGENCTVSSKTRLIKCIIMKNVLIKEGCVLENCIISDDVIIGRECELKNCLVGAHFAVSDGTKCMNQVLSKMDDLMEI